LNVDPLTFLTANHDDDEVAAILEELDYMVDILNISANEILSMHPDALMEMLLAAMFGIFDDFDFMVDFDDFDFDDED